MIIVLEKDGFGGRQQYKSPEHGWSFPSVEAAVNAAKARIRRGAVSVEIWDRPGGDEATYTPEGTLVRCFDRGSSGQAVERRV